MIAHCVTLLMHVSLGKLTSTSFTQINSHINHTFRLLTDLARALKHAGVA